MTTIFPNRPMSIISRAVAAALLAACFCLPAHGDEPAPPKTPPAAKAAAPGQPASPADRKKQIDRLIEQLGDKDFFVRQRAQQELLKIGFDAFDALSAATGNEDLEIAARAKAILRTIRMDWVQPGDSPEVQDLLQDYEDLNPGYRRIRIQALAELPDGEGLPALGRLARFEKSSRLSKQAAVAILGAAPDAPTEKNLIEPLQKILAAGNRPAARWLRAWLQPADNPTAFENQWTKLIEAEQQVLRRTPTQTAPEIVTALWRFQGAAIKKRGDQEASFRALRRMIAPDNVAPESLQELLDALVEQKAWPVAAELLARYAGQISANPLLMYTYAQAKAEQGQAAAAEELALRAFRLNPGNNPPQLLAHSLAAEELNRRGLFDWSRREFEYLLQQKNDLDDVAVAWKYSEALHEQGDDLKAARVIDALDETKLAQRLNRDALPLTTREIQSQKHFYYACHWQSQNKPAKQREALEKAFLLQPDNIEVLIAYYHLPGNTPEVRRKIKEQIAQYADELRSSIIAQPSDHGNYNEYAWLIGNTEGDLDEALKFSQESLKLLRKSPELIQFTGGYLDTLARVHYARGEYAAAVKIQTQALRLDPHSTQIAKQLELFKKTRQEKEKP
jgi:tetratricopeptide (TPR) repeat protein